MFPKEEQIKDGETALSLLQRSWGQVESGNDVVWNICKKASMV